MVHPLPEELRRVEHIPVVLHPSPHTKAHIQDLLTDICIVIDIDNKYVVLSGGDDGGEGPDEVVVQGAEEGRLGDGVQTDGDAVVEHVLCDQAYKETTCRLDRVDAICKRKGKI